MRKNVLVIKENCLSKEAEKKLDQIRKSGIHVGNLINKWIIEYGITKN